MKIYVPHECKTLEEVNALALTDRQENGAYVISPTGELCQWSLPYAVRNDGEGYWSYQDGYGGDSIHFPLSANETVTVLAPMEVEERHDRTTGHLVPGVGGGVALYIDHCAEDRLHERMVWSTEWKPEEGA